MASSVASHRRTIAATCSYQVQCKFDYAAIGFIHNSERISDAIPNDLTLVWWSCTIPVTIYSSGLKVVINSESCLLIVFAEPVAEQDNDCSTCAIMCAGTSSWFCALGAGNLPGFPVIRRANARI